MLISLPCYIIVGVFCQGTKSTIGSGDHVSGADRMGMEVHQVFVNEIDKNK